MGLGREAVMEEVAVGRRWLLFLITYCMATPLASYGVFHPSSPSASGGAGAISAALSMSLLVGGIAGFAAGALADRYGPD
jgi:MFS family permease